MNQLNFFTLVSDSIVLQEREVELAVLAAYHPRPFSVSECNLANYRYLSRWKKAVLLEHRRSIFTIRIPHVSHPECVKLVFPVVLFWLILGHFFNRLTSTPMSLNSMMVLKEDSGRAWKKALMSCFKGKGKAVTFQTVKAYRANRGVVPLILNVGTTTRPLYPRKKNPVPVEYEAILRYYPKIHLERQAG